MKKILASTSVLIASALLFGAGIAAQRVGSATPTAPTSLRMIEHHFNASGPTIPPGPWEDGDVKDGSTNVASYSGPTIPPGPWDDGDVKDGGTNVVSYSGPTIPPGPWDDGDVKDGGTQKA